MNTILIILVICIVRTTAKGSLSDYIPICDAKSPELNSCVVKSANLLVPQLGKGIKELGFPSLDPLVVTKMEIGQNNGPIDLKLTLFNATHVGLSTLKFRTASIDTENNRWVLNGTLPYLSVSGKYISDGKILIVPVVGEGKAKFVLNDTVTDFVITGSPRTDKSDVYFDVTSLRVYFHFKKTFVSLTNLFGGNKILGDRTNNFLNENSQEVMSGLRATLQDVYSVLYMDLVKRIISKVPYNQLLNNV